MKKNYSECKKNSQNFVCTHMALSDKSKYITNKNSLSHSLAGSEMSSSYANDNNDMPPDAILQVAAADAFCFCNAKENDLIIATSCVSSQKLLLGPSRYQDSNTPSTLTIDSSAITVCGSTSVTEGVASKDINTVALRFRRSNVDASYYVSSGADTAARSTASYPSPHLSCKCFVTGMLRVLASTTFVDTNNFVGCLTSIVQVGADDAIHHFALSTSDAHFPVVGIISSAHFNSFDEQTQEAVYSVTVQIVGMCYVQVDLANWSRQLEPGSLHGKPIYPSGSPGIASLLSDSRNVPCGIILLPPENGRCSCLCKLVPL